MSDPINELKGQWDKAKTSSEPMELNTSEIIASANKKMKSVVYSHYANILILTLTVIMISSFFYYITPFKQLLSQIGVAMMIGGLLIRITIECFSVFKSKKIDLSETAAKTNLETVKFYAYRKKIHGPITISILIVYTIGFYILTPEFSEHLTLNQVILMDSSYVLIAIILIYSIRKGIKDEMQLLNELTTFSLEFEEE
ncbi:hypothetical protein [Ekhidna sp.]